MSIQSTYRTMQKQSEGLYREKGSKFIGYAVACYSENEAKEYLETWKKAHHQARHLCYAYRFGENQDVYRANDDGEPNNSAGMPILGQLQSFDLSNTLVGVVRYFGGTKLGVGGLITAYKTAAKEAIESGVIIELEVFEWVQLNFDYLVMPDVMNFIKQNQLVIKSQDFELSCEMQVSLPLNTAQALKEMLESYPTMKITEIGKY
jgi:uncharacterized YigZ family protein